MRSKPCRQAFCPNCDPRGFLTALARTVNIVEDQGLTDADIDARVDYILEGRAA